MKHSGIVLALAIMLNWYVPLAASGTQANEVSMDNALESVKNHFSDKDVLFYLVENDIDSKSNASFWQFFVDLAPGYGWEHDCCIVEVPRFSNESTVSISNIISRRFPPNSKLTPIRSKSGMLKAIEESRLMTQPCVDKRVLSREDSLTAKRTCAIILSGGINTNSNYARYWNDCSFLYQVLVNRYGIPKDNIHVAISDGTSNDIDMNLELSSGATCSSPLDLDFDGQPDTRYKATKEGLSNALSNISAQNEIAPFDHFFLFVIDHGGHCENRGSYICLWSGDKDSDSDEYKLYSDELLTMLSQITNKVKFKSAVMAQCFSGGFIEPFSNEGFVIATATKENELSSTMNKHKFDYFAYNWTCGMNGKNELKYSVYADTDHDGYVSMKEAFNYAASCYTGATEHPQYASNPSKLGDKLSFHSLPLLEPDIYIRDNYNDTGEETNTYDKFWDSPDIWLGNGKSGALMDYYWPDSIAEISVKIHNRGFSQHSGGKWLNIYWSISSPTLSANDWKGKQGGIGGRVCSKMIDNLIEAGDSTIITVPWVLNEDAKRNLRNNGNVNLLVFIGNSPYAEIDDSYDVKKSKFLAQKNYSRYRPHNRSHSDTIWIKNLDNTQRWFTIEPANYRSSMNLFNLNLEISLSDILYKGWTDGGSKYFNCDLKRNSFITSKTNAVIDGIRMSGYQKGETLLSLSPGPNYNGSTPMPTSYKFDFVVKADGNIIGGITYKISTSMALIMSEDLGNDTYLLSTDLEEDNYEYIRWFDAKGKSLGYGNNIVVTLASDMEEVTVEAKNNDGFIEQDKLLLRSEVGIENISLNADKSRIEIKFDGQIKANTLFKITSLTQFNNTQLCTRVTQGDDKCQVDISDLIPGLYILSYFVNDNLVENIKFIK